MLRQKEQNHRSTEFLLVALIVAYILCDNTTIAYDMYLDALGSDPRAKSPRQELLRKRSIGRRWRAYAEPSSLLLAVYSDFAETSM